MPKDEPGARGQSTKRTTEVLRRAAFPGGKVEPPDVVRAYQGSESAGSSLPSFCTGVDPLNVPDT